MTDRNPLSQTDRRTGMTVPDGYFEDFNKRMADMLPPQPWETEAADQKPNVMPRTFWQRVRPYAYMAAMFAGIWLMMNISTLVPSTGTATGTTTPVPAAPDRTLAVVMSSSADNDVADYAMNYFDDSDIYDDLYDSGFNPADLN